MLFMVTGAAPSVMVCPWTTTAGARGGVLMSLLGSFGGGSGLYDLADLESGIMLSTEACAVIDVTGSFDEA